MKLFIFAIWILTSLVFGALTVAADISFKSWKFWAFLACYELAYFCGIGFAHFD